MVILDLQEEKLLLIPMEVKVHMEVVLFLAKTQVKLIGVLHMQPGILQKIW